MRRRRLAALHSTPILTVACLCHLVIPSAGVGQSSTVPENAVTLLAKRHTDHRTLLRGDWTNDRVSVLYRSAKDVVSNVRVHPKGHLIAAIETAVDATYASPPRNRLIVLNPQGQVVHRVDRDVQNYTFSPDGNHLAYVVGPWYEGGVGFLPEALFILDLATQKEQRVPDISAPYALHWLQTDDEDAIFTRTLDRRPENRVMRYDLRQQRAQAEPSGAFHLSPDGRYFLRRAEALIAEGRCHRRSGLCLEVIERSSGQVVALPEDLLEDDRRRLDAEWVYGRGHLLLISRRDEERETVRERRGFRTVDAQYLRRIRHVDNRVLDVATGDTVERPDGIPCLATSRDRDEEWSTVGPQLLLRRVAPARLPTRGEEASSNTSPQESLRRNLELRTLDPPPDPGIGSTHQGP